MLPGPHSQLGEVNTPLCSFHLNALSVPIALALWAQAGRAMGKRVLRPLLGGISSPSNTALSSAPWLPLLVNILPFFGDTKQQPSCVE